MAYEPLLSDDAVRHLAGFRAGERRAVTQAIDRQLRDQPTTPSRNRKPLRENPLASWELRVGRFRVLYNVSEDDQQVEIVAIGVKDRSKLVIEGEEADL